MKFLIGITTFLLLSYQPVSAIPLVAAVPFVFDIAVLFYAGFSFLLFGGIQFLFKYKKISIFFPLILSLIVTTVIFYIVSWYQFSIITLDVYYFYIKYIYLFTFIVLSSLILGILIFFFHRMIFLFLLLQVIYLSISLYLLFSIFHLNLSFDKLLDNFSKTYSSADIVPRSQKILNNIIVSQDLSFTYKGERQICRISLSYYYHQSGEAYSNTGVKTDILQMYTGLGNGTRGFCRELFTPAFQKVLNPS